MPQLSVFFATALSSVPHSFFAFTVRSGDVLEARERPIFLRRFDVDFNDFAQIADNISTDSPSTSSIPTSLD
jgi:hypothetical protein